MLLACLLPLAQHGNDEPELTSGRPIPPEQSCYDVRGYQLNVRVDPEARSIQGRVLVSADVLTASDDLVLDLDAHLKVEKVFLRRNVPVQDTPEKLDAPVDFRHENGEIRIHAPDFLHEVGSKLIVTVLYGGVPREAPRPPWDGGFVWSKTEKGAPWIATCNQMQGADLWWPCKDQPDDEAEEVEIRVTVPAPLVVASNGRLEGVESDQDAVTWKAMRGWNTYRWHVSTPINTYGIALNIAPYETISRDYTSVAGDTFPVTYWVLPENLEKGKVLFEDILRQMRAFEELFGPYPFRGDKYGVAETPHLGMEHQSIIAYGNGYRMDRWGEDRGYDELHLHEFAHEWWANLVTCANWNDFWIHEGFASYAQALYAERVGGEKAYFTEMGEQRRFANRAAIAPRARKSTAEMYFGDREGSPGGDIYAKGAWVLHTLRWLLTDERFFPALRRMAYPDPALEKTTDGSACRFATTDELLAIAEKSSGLELDWFFEVYLRQPALPELEWQVEGNALLLAWKSPTGAPLPMPVEVRLGEEFVRVECPDGQGRLALGGRTDFAVDPRERVLRAGEGSRGRRGR
jgi:aminopeptidase N